MASGPGLQAVLDALGSPVRREILWLVWDQELTAGAIVAAVQLSGPAVSEHLAMLRHARLVAMTKDGSFRRYRANRDRLVGLQALVFGESTKWVPADDLPERASATAALGHAVEAVAELGVGVEAAFRAFVDPAVYSRWLGVPVSLVNGQFSTTLEWGTRIRGTYDHLVEPSFIAMRWDFEDDNMPVPGNELFAYLHLESTRRGCRVTVRQFADTLAHAQFLEVAWTMVLGRLKEGVKAALVEDPGARAVRARAPRPKTKPS